MPYKDPEKGKEYHQAYAKEWAEANRDKLKAANKRHYEVHRDEILADRRAKDAEERAAKPPRVQPDPARVREVQAQDINITRRKAVDQVKREEGIDQDRKARNAARAHEYYLANRDAILVRQKISRDAHKDTKRAYQQKWYEANRDHRKEVAIRYASANKDAMDAKRIARLWALKREVWEHYGGARCSCCGESAELFLTIDHINGGGRQHINTLPGRAIYRRLKVQGYPDGFRVLCMNCNWAFGVHGSCPHQTA